MQFDPPWEANNAFSIACTCWCIFPGTAQFTHYFLASISKNHHCHGESFCATFSIDLLNSVPTRCQIRHQRDVNLFREGTNLCSAAALSSAASLKQLTICNCLRLNCLELSQSNHQQVISDAFNHLLTIHHLSLPNRYLLQTGNC